jgi:hypothetical protein
MADLSDELGLNRPLTGEALQQAVHERWQVKTGADSDAHLIDASAVTAGTIAELRAFGAPASPPATGRTKPVETTIWELDATLVAYKLEQDQDYHLVLSDAHAATMIAEIPNPAAAPGSRFLPQITASRDAFAKRFQRQLEALAAGGPGEEAPMIVHISVPVHVTGVGFFDFIHGQAGVAPNGIELHPVLSIAFPNKPQSSQT